MTSHATRTKGDGSPGMTRQERIAKAWALRATGASLFGIATQLGVTKEWLRDYAGMTDR
jgi:hypothetical protein